MLRAVLLFIPLGDTSKYSYSLLITVSLYSPYFLIVVTDTFKESKISSLISDKSVYDEIISLQGTILLKIR